LGKALPKPFSTSTWDLFALLTIPPGIVLQTTATNVIGAAEKLVLQVLALLITSYSAAENVRMNILPAEAKHVKIPNKVGDQENEV